MYPYALASPPPGIEIVPVLSARLLPWLVKSRSGDRKLLDAKGKDFADCAPSYVMSLVHAVVVSSLGLKIMVGLTS